jgi:hypothetical protein
MNHVRTPSQPIPGSSLPSLPPSFANAANFWEVRRVLYTILLGTVLAAWIVLSWPHFRPAMTPLHLFQSFVLGSLANLCYSAAYVIDRPLQRCFAGSALLRSRWTLWILGTLLAIFIENYWIADEIYPFVS